MRERATCKQMVKSWVKSHFLYTIWTFEVPKDSTVYPLPSEKDAIVARRPTVAKEGGVASPKVFTMRFLPPSSTIARI